MSMRNKTSTVSSLNTLSVSGRIALGFAIVLALHLSVVVLGHYGLRKAETDRQIQTLLLEQVEAFYGIDQVVRDLQRNVLLFASTGYDGPGERVGRLQELLLARLDAAAELSIGNSAAGVDAGHIEAMRSSLEVQEAIFDDVVVDRAKRREVIEEDFVAIEARFTQSLESMKQRPNRTAESVYAAQSLFNAAQLNALRYANSPDSNLVSTVKRQLGETIEHLRRANASNENDRAAAIRAARDFEVAFIQMVQTTRGYLHLVNVVLAGESAEFLYLTEHVRDVCLASAALLSSKLQQDNAAFERISTAFSLLTIGLGVVVSWVIGRTIAPPLNAITQTLDGLAKGECYERIPGTTRCDELGKLAHAAEVFREKAADTERLLSEVTRMKDMERQLAQSQRLESMGQLAAGVAHEINTPMQAIATNVDFLADALDNILNVVEAVGKEIASGDKEAIEIVESIDRTLSNPRFRHAVGNASPAISDTTAAAVRVVEITRAMKTMSHPGKADLEATDVNKLVQDAATISCNRWKYAATLDLELDEHLPHPLAFGAALSQVVLNLLVNAADAIVEKVGENGAIGRIVLRTYGDEDMVCIEVEDSGLGIPSERRDRVFEMFYTTKDVGKGTGQGLALCYDVVTRQHQGSISIEDGSIGGARFVIRLPVAPEIEAGHGSTELETADPR